MLAGEIALLFYTTIRASILRTYGLRPGVSAQNQPIPPEGPLDCINASLVVCHSPLPAQIL